MVIAIEDGKPVIKLNVLGSTESGDFYTKNPLNAAGAARIAFGQYKAWRVGTHHPGKRRARGFGASRQAFHLQVFNKDDKRRGDKIDVGAAFYINQHSGYNAPVNDIGRLSAGCPGQPHDRRPQGIYAPREN